MLAIRTMTPTDAPVVLALSEQAGWNQGKADWQRFLAMEPEGCFVAETNGEPVGTTVTCVFGGVAWIGMVLVDPRARRRGVATGLMKHALAYLEGRGVQTVRLDATETGRLVYEGLSFVTEFSLTRYQGTAPPAGENAQVVSATPDMYDELIAFDARAAGANREKMLTRLFSTSPCGTRVLNRRGQLEGFITTRSGVHALQIGPCIASPSAGAILLSDMLNRCAGQPVILDVPCQNTTATRVTESLGFKAQRHFIRMYRGCAPTGDASALWASSGPEKG
ncbi:MAG: GNAT family N-acetyltransferase [Planctomycetes bacterium]|nr:GNAT family N-acetyltransferase [Planctomycetota bacterium]